MKKGFLVAVMILFVGLISGCQTTSNIYTYILDEDFEGFITLGTSADYAPYEWPMNVDGKTTLVGIDIEIAKEIAKASSKNLKVVNKGFDFLLDDLENGKVDFVLAGMTPTEERAKQVDFSMVYYEAIQVVLVKKSMLNTFNSIETMDLASVRIGAQLGSIQQELVEDTFLTAQKSFIQSVPDLVMRLIDGQVDAVVMEKPVADGYVLNQSSVAIASITIGDPDGGSAVAVRKGNIELLKLINIVLSDLIESGKMDQIVADAVILNS
ncbi:transporter substrate-binding domain-containing protein [Acholeplasma vituli]|uniref:Transporter substrate-binding domain-containing protein n=1 Tax=Paracholeplasma vituli TaxID=69473 RepID=A0ABT2PX64_9MOLU|nr:transporter substrate-binding domain-containing protein [Paracholeplasma vituli]MCU0105554.1 transporter substrate-binding domain-containing protein [Paracholeplasma vituli]